MVGAWWWTHFPGINFLPPLPHSLGMLQPVHKHIRFYHVFMLVRATRKVKTFPNLSERKCIISHDCVCSHATVIQSEPVEIHTHAFRREGAVVEEKKGDDEGRTAVVCPPGSAKLVLHWINSNKTALKWHQVINSTREACDSLADKHKHSSVLSANPRHISAYLAFSYFSFSPDFSLSLCGGGIGLHQGTVGWDTAETLRHVRSGAAGGAGAGFQLIQTGLHRLRNLLDRVW